MWILQNWIWVLRNLNCICFDDILSCLVPSSDTLEDATFEEDDKDNDDDNEWHTNTNNPLPAGDDVIKQGWSVVLEYCQGVNNIAFLNTGFSISEEWSSPHVYWLKRI